MTELDRVNIVEQRFPEWRQHLNDGKMIDLILDRLAYPEIVPNKCSRPGCKNVTRRGRKTCIECAVKAAGYIRTHRRKAANAKEINQSIDAKFQDQCTPHD